MARCHELRCWIASAHSRKAKYEQQRALRCRALRSRRSGTGTGKGTFTAENSGARWLALPKLVLDCGYGDWLGE